jgi:hypothetical protein
MATLWIRGKKPQKQRLARNLAAGVVSETRDYTERPFSRPEKFSVKLS